VAPGPEISSDLQTIAKVLNQLANGKTFTKEREAHFQVMNEFIENRQKSLTKFLESLTVRVFGSIW
jgi:hypothetical protein